MIIFLCGLLGYHWLLHLRDSEYRSLLTAYSWTKQGFTQWRKLSTELWHIGLNCDGESLSGGATCNFIGQYSTNCSISRNCLPNEKWSPRTECFVMRWCSTTSDKLSCSVRVGTAVVIFFFLNLFFYYRRRDVDKLYVLRNKRMLHSINVHAIPYRQASSMLASRGKPEARGATVSEFHTGSDRDHWHWQCHPPAMSHNDTGGATTV